MTEKGETHYDNLIQDGLGAGASVSEIMELIRRLERKKGADMVRDNITKTILNFVKNLHPAMIKYLDDDLQGHGDLYEICTEVRIGDLIEFGAKEPKEGRGEQYFEPVYPSLPRLLFDLKKDLILSGCKVDDDFGELTLESLFCRLMEALEEMGIVTDDACRFECERFKIEVRALLKE